jgi:hypothetical protein
MFKLSQKDLAWRQAHRQGTDPLCAPANLTDAEAVDLAKLRQEGKLLRQWYEHMRVAACIGLLRPGQLVTIGASRAVVMHSQITQVSFTVE